MRVLFAYAALTLTAGGCWSSIEQYCPGCARGAPTQVAAPAPGTHTEVVLVHGAFGFGAEWTPIVNALRHTPGFDFFAWSWRGLDPFGNPLGEAQSFYAELQSLIENLPPSVPEILILAHSAGGLLTNLVVRRLHVKPGQRVTVALLDPVFWPLLNLWPELARPETYAQVPAGVTMTVYVAEEPPPLADKLRPPDPVTATDLPRIYVGSIGHNPMVAHVALSLLAARRQALATPQDSSH